MHVSTRLTTAGAHHVDLRRISDALSRAAQTVAGANMQDLRVKYGRNGSPVTSLDRKINQTIRQTLLARNEGWLSEENRDDLVRLKYQRVWIVDPIDGTRELLNGIPEWCVSIGLAKQGKVVAGGVFNPCTSEMFLGSSETGLSVSRFDGMRTALEPTAEAKQTQKTPNTPLVLVSRKEYSEEKWQPFENRQIKITPVGSIAYRLAIVAAGYADATCTFEPRSEWDIAAGVALVQASGGTVHTLGGVPVRFNSKIPQLKMLCAFSKNCSPLVYDMLSAAALSSRCTNVPTIRLRRD